MIELRMARSAKGARNIIVDGVAYRWRATGNDDWISLVVWPADPVAHPAGAIVGMVDYQQVKVPAGPDCWRLEHQIVITNRIVRRVILHAIAAHHYDPTRKSSQLNLRYLDEFIDLTDALRG